MSTSRDPWLAANLSWSFSGLGQFYAGRKRAGLIFLGLEILVLCGCLGWALSSDASTVVLAAMLGLETLLWIVSSAMAFQAIKADPEFQPIAKSPWKSLFFTRLLPGLGHLYARRWMRGVLLLAVVAAYSIWQPPERLILWAFAGFYLVKLVALVDSF